MARHILIVEESDMMRRVLQARILSSLNEAVISEAAGIGQAKGVIARSTVHLILYGWDIHDRKGLDFCRRVAAGGNGAAIPFLLLVNDQREHLELAAELAGNAYLALPCSAEALAQAIDRVCSPAALRQAKRYSLLDTQSVIEQRQVRIAASVQNISLGGALCEFEMEPQLNSAYPCMLTLIFAGEDGPVQVGEIRAVVSNLLVIDRHPDQTPKLIRLGLKFLQLSGPGQERLEQILSQSQEGQETSA